MPALLTGSEDNPFCLRGGVVYAKGWDALLLENMNMRILLLLLLVTTGSLRAVTYEQSYKLPPMQFNASELRATLRIISDIVTRSNQTLISHYEVLIEDEDSGTTAKFGEFTIPEVRLPSPATHIRIVFYSFSDTPVSSIFVDLSDDRRELHVEGASYTEVGGSAALIYRELASHSSTFGGPGFRATLLAVTGLVFMAFSIFFGEKKRYGYVCFFIALFLALYFSALVFPWKYVFPGFLFHETEPSWIVRYSPQFTFIALVLTVLIPVLQFTITKNSPKKIRKKKSETPLKTDEAS